MNESQHQSNDRLEEELRVLASTMVFPPTPTFQFPSRPSPSDDHVAPSPAPAPTPRVFRPTRHHLLRWSAAMSLVMVLALLIPNVRHAAADLLGIPVIRIEIGSEDDARPTTVTTIGGTLLLGEPASLDTVANAFTHALMIPDVSTISKPPEVYLNTLQGVPVVSLLYPASDTLPEIGTTGAGLLVMAIDDAGASKFPMIKRSSAESPPQPVSINGQDGTWIEGGMLTVEGNDPFWTFQRRSGNVLIWVDQGVTYRMESALGLEDSLAIAASLVPVED